VAKPVKKWLKRVLLGAVALTLVGWLAGAWMLQTWTAKPPPPPPRDRAIRLLKPEPRDGKLCWANRGRAGARG